MAGAGEIRAGRSYVECYLQDNPLTRGLDRAAKRLAAWGASITAIGTRLATLGSLAIAGASLLSAAKGFGEMGEELVELSQRTGASVESISELQYAFGQSGVSAEALGGVFRHLQHLIGQASTGSHEAAQTLARLGVSFGELKAQAPDQQLETVLDAVGKLGDQSQRTQLLMAAFGREGAMLAPAALKGKAGIEQLREELRQMGGLISTDDAQAGATFHRTLAALTGSLKTVNFQVGAALAPLLQKLAIQLIRVAYLSAGWIKENRGLIESAFKLALWLPVVGAGLVAVGYAFTALSTAAGLLVGTWSALVSVLGFFLSPLGLVIGSLGVLVYVAGNLAGVWQGWPAMFRQIGDTAQEAFGGIKDALAAGDLTLAWKIATEGIKVAWLELVNFMEDKWGGFKDYWTDTWLDIMRAMMEDKGGIGTLWKGMLGNFIDQATAAAKLLHPEQAGEIEAGRKRSQEALAAGRFDPTGLQAERDRQRQQEKGDREFKLAMAQMSLDIDVSMAALKKALRSSAAAAEKVNPPPAGAAVGLAATGTFNALQAAGLAFEGGPMQEIADNTADIATSSRQTEKNTRGGNNWG